MRLLPGWARSVRFRLALTYSLVVFGLAAVVILGVNLALSESLDDQPVSRQTQFRTFVAPSGAVITIEETVQGRFVTLEQLVNERARENLRRFSFLALLGMFPVSLAAGWLIADRALAPIGEITGVAREIQSSDLSRRIELEGPDDELKQLADTFDAMLDRIESGLDAQREFIQDTSHELRNPLAVMAANLDVVLADEDADAETLRATAQIVRRSVNRTARTVDDLVLFARQEVPDSKLEMVDLKTLAHDVLTDHQALIDSSRLIVTGGGDSVEVPADPAALKRAFGNIVGNAVRLAPPGTEITLTCGRQGAWAFLGLEDRGPGIAAADHSAIFQRRWTQDPTSLDGEARSGLGLAITRQVAESHRGTVTVRSAPGEGAAFVIWLPLEARAMRDAITEDGIHPIRDPFASHRA